MKQPVRNVIQIATSTTTVEDHYQNIVVALCDDGTLWTFTDDGVNSHWMALPEIPQTEFTNLPQEIHIESSKALNAHNDLLNHNHGTPHHGD